MIDVKHHISAVSRSLGSRELPAGQARMLTIARTYDSSIEDVWDACTNPERIARWFLPVSGELRLGGRYQLQGNAGGVVERCDPPNSFAATWEFGDDVSWVELRLTTVDAGTRFELAHVAQERWLEYGPGAVGIGWDSILLGLALHVDSGSDRPADPVAWMQSPTGREFVTLSGHSWIDADIDAGTPSEQAHAAGERVIAAYTGV
jgi:uncharacterized protein YndB with AHSA1/START domain